MSQADHLCDLIAASRNGVVFPGAGISTNLGCLLGAERRARTDSVCRRGVF